MQLYAIRDAALKSKRAVYTIQQLANLIKAGKAVAKVYSSRLVKKGLAKRILRGKISFAEDDHVIGSQLSEPCYISLNSALLFHSLIMQVPANVECVTTKNSRRYPALGLVYHKIPASLFYGYEKYEKAGSYVFVADPEKALIDAVYLNVISKETAGELSARVDRKKLSAYLSRATGRGRKKLERWLL